MKKNNFSKKYIYRHPYDDRLYSQLIRHLLSFFISKILNITHIHIPFKNNHINNNFSKIYKINMLIDKTTNDLDINKLIKEKQAYSKPDQNLVGLNKASKKYFDINLIFSKDHIELMKSSYKFNNIGNNFNLSDINISLHIRRGDITKYGVSCGRFTPNNFFVNTIIDINKILKNNCTFHIYSDSNINLNIEKDINIIYHINTDLLTSVNEMINSDIFIMSIGSNLSHFVGLHTSGIVFLDKNKLKPCFNNKYNIYWSNYKYFISDKKKFELQLYKILNKKVCKKF